LRDDPESRDKPPGLRHYRQPSGVAPGDQHHHAAVRPLPSAVRLLTKGRRELASARGFRPQEYKAKAGDFSPAFLLRLRRRVRDALPGLVTLQYVVDTSPSRIARTSRTRPLLDYEQVAETILTESTFNVGPAPVAPAAALAPAG